MRCYCIGNKQYSSIFVQDYQKTIQSLVWAGRDRGKGGERERGGGGGGGEREKNTLSWQKPYKTNELSIEYQILTELHPTHFQVGFAVCTKGCTTTIARVTQIRQGL